MNTNSDQTFSQEKDQSSESSSVESSSSAASGALSSAGSSSVFSYGFVISEVMWMGSDLSTADEWVEIAALSEASSATGMPASLSGWTLKIVKDGGVEQVIMRFASQSIPIGGYGIISNYPESQSRLAAVPLAVSAGMSLANTKLLLRLYDGQGVLRDEVDDGVGNPFAGTNASTAKASMERIDLRIPGTIASNWRAAAQSVGFDAVPFVLLGSPGHGNGSASSASSIPASSSASSFLSVSSASSIASISSSSVPSLRINEILPDAVGSDDLEWIEIMNAGSGTVSTAGITVSMTGGTVRPLPAVTLSGGQLLLLPKEQTHLSMPNAGGTVQLKQGNIVLDFITYPSLPEGISFGPDASGMKRPLCLPTPSAYNTSSGSQVAIDVQSGMPTGETVTLNLALRAVAGSVQGATCHWEYPDGYESESCNPPSHSVDIFGGGEIRLEFRDYCGTTMIQTLPVFVTKKPRIIQDESKNGAAGFSCMPSNFSGALITEFVPNPDGNEEEGEWIELKNISGKDLPLCGWRLEDGVGTRFELKKFRLPLDETLVFSRKQTGITLNNDADTLRLVAPDPSGGSGVLLQEVSFSHAPAEEAFALRDDGVWIWTPDKTPGAPNSFPEVVLPDGPAKARLSAVLPNPKGPDEGLEWIEIENLTGRPLWMQKWTLRSGSITADLSGMAIHPYAKRRILAADVGMTLRNASGSVRLFDERGAEMAPLVWMSAHDDEVAMPPVFQKQEAGIVESIGEDGSVRIRTASGIVLDSSLAGFELFRENSECINLESALTINKKIDLYFNTIGEGAVVVLGGYDIAGVLLKFGCGYRSHRSDEGVFLGYDLFEREAKMNRRGIWATEESMAAAVEIQSVQHLQGVVEEEGILLTSTLKEELTQSGAVLSFQTNVPASVYVSVNDGPFMVFSSGTVLTDDTVIQAYALLHTGTGTPLKSDILEHTYVLRKASYDRLQLLSEIYPSPRKGEKEWLELRNPTDRVVNLAGWQIDDGLDEGSRPFTLTSSFIINPRSFLTVRDIKVAWNNDGDAVRLIAPDGMVVDSMMYPKTKTGLAFDFHPETNAWCFTEKPTPQDANVCFLSPPKVKKSNSRSALSKSKKSSSLRKVLYRNVLHPMDVNDSQEDIFHRLESLFFFSSLPSNTAPQPFRATLLFLCILYCAFIGCFLGFRRY